MTPALVLVGVVVTAFCVGTFLFVLFTSPKDKP